MYLLKWKKFRPHHQSYGFSSSYVWMWELDHKESWALKNWCFWTVVLEKTLESPLDCKEIQPVHPKGDQSWIFTGRTDAEAETLILRPPDEKNWLIGKDPDAGKDWRQEEKGTTEDEMVGWHHRLHGHEFDQVLGVGDGQGSLVCYMQSKGSQRVGHWVTRLNWTVLRWNQDPTPSLHYCFLAAPPLFLHPFPSWNSNSLNLPFGTQGRSWGLESRNGTERLLLSFKTNGIRSRTGQTLLSDPPIPTYFFFHPAFATIQV